MSEPPTIHPQALVSTDRIGSGTTVEAFAQVRQGAVVGADCKIGSSAVIEAGARLGQRVVIGNGVTIPAGAGLEDGVCIGSGAVLANDHLPRTRRPRDPLRPDRIMIGEGATIGAGAVLVGPLKIGAQAFIGAGAVVLADAADHALVYGNPGRREGWACECGARLNSDLDCPACGLSYVPKAGGGLIRR